MSRVVHFEIQADDVERAKSFYAAVFDWSFQDYGEVTGSTYWGIVTGPEDQMGINGGLLQRPAPAPAPQQGPTPSCAPWVSVTTTRPSGASSPPAARSRCPRWHSPAWRGRYYLDTEGNTFGIHQPDPEAR